MIPNAQLGEFGEQETRSRLERCLLGSGVRFQGQSDKGLDLVLQFQAPATNEVLHFGVQVKAGDSYAELHRSRWRIKNIPAERFRQWSKSRLPVLLVWVRPTTPAECYWGLVTKDASVGQFSISRNALISPALRYDLALGVARDHSEALVRGSLLVPPLHGGVQPAAKAHYRAMLRSRRALSNPVLGSVKLSWRAWRHMTRQGRAKHHISQSLQLLPSLPAVVAGATQFIGLRRLDCVRRGNWTTEIRLVAFRGPTLTFDFRPPADTRIVFRERIRYPRDWTQDVNLHKNIVREVTVESLYEKAR